MKVFPHLIRRLASHARVDIIPMDRKPNLIALCGEAAAGLIAAGYDRVLIIWDLFPAWREGGERPCRREDRAGIQASPAGSGVAMKQVSLICITEELEAWLIADGRALGDVLSRPTHRVKIGDRARTDRERNPKKTMNRFFQEHSGIPYSDRRDAIRIATAIPDWTRIRHSESFLRFAQKVTGKPLA